MLMKKFSKNTTKNNTIHEINVVDMDKPDFLNCYIVMFSIHYHSRDNDYNYSENRGYSIKFENVENVIRFINCFNEEAEHNGVISTLKKLAEEMKNEEFEFFQFVCYHFNEDDYKDERVKSFKKAEIEDYFDEYGRRREVLVNTKFSPFTNIEMYSNEDLIALECEDNNSKTIPKLSYFLWLNDGDLENVPFDKDFLHTYIFEETDSHYHVRFNPSQLDRYGFIPALKNEYKGFGSSILVLIDKETLQLYSEEEPVFNNFKVRNKSFR